MALGLALWHSLFRVAIAIGRDSYRVPVLTTHGRCMVACFLSSLPLVFFHVVGLVLGCVAWDEEPAQAEPQIAQYRSDREIRSRKHGVVIAGGGSTQTQFLAENGEHVGDKIKKNQKPTRKTNNTKQQLIKLRTRKTVLETNSLPSHQWGKLEIEFKPAVEGGQAGTR